MQVFIGRADQCLGEALELQYAYFSPELDNFDGEVKVSDVLFKIISEVDHLDEGSLHDSLDEDGTIDGYKWNGNRNNAWRRKATAFLNRWADDSDENQDEYKNI